MTCAIISSEAKHRSFNWRLFLLLLGLGAFGLIALVPYGLTVAGQQLTRSQLGLLAIQFVPQIVVLAVQVGLGLLMSEHIGLGAPLLSSWLAGERVKPGLKAILLSVLIGVIVGTLTLALDLWVFAPAVEAEYLALGIVLPENPNPPVWQGFPASFYGGINEEILLRLFLLTLFAWLGSKISHTANGRPTPVVLWTATILAGLALGLGHLPAAATMGIPLTALYVCRIIVLNLSGIVFGWLYWKRGLANAMAAHFSTDIVLHVIGAVVMGLD